MRRKFKKLIMTLSIVLLVIAMAGEKPIKSEAKTKNGTYYFLPCMATKFQKKITG